MKGVERLSGFYLNLLIVLALLSFEVNSGEVVEENIPDDRIEEMVIIGSQQEVRELPGSGAFVTEEQMEEENITDKANSFTKTAL